jgi:hypothetical protein
MGLESFADAVEAFLASGIGKGRGHLGAVLGLTLDRVTNFGEVRRLP